MLGPRLPARAISLLYSVISWNPAWRSSAQEALKHSYFRQQTGQSSAGPATAAPNLNLALKPSRQPKQRTEAAPGAGAGAGAGEAVGRGKVAVSQVEPVFGRELLRNYRAGAGAGPGGGSEDRDEAELRLLLESLKSSDVVPVKHKKQAASKTSGQNYANEAETNKYNHKVSLLDADEPNNLSGERRYSKSPPKIKSTFSNGKLATQRQSALSSYIPSFGKNDSLGGGPLVARRLLGGERDTARDVTRDTNHNNHDKLAKQISTDGANNNDLKTGPGGFLKKSTFGTQETLGTLSSKADFSTRVLESFSDFHLGPGSAAGDPPPRLMSKADISALFDTVLISYQRRHCYKWAFYQFVSILKVYGISFPEYCTLHDLSNTAPMSGPRCTACPSSSPRPCWWAPRRRCTTAASAATCPRSWRPGPSRGCRSARTGKRSTSSKSDTGRISLS